MIFFAEGASNEAVGLWVVIALLILRGAVDFKNLLAKPKTEAVSAPIPTPVIVQEQPEYAKAKGVKDLSDRVSGIDDDLHKLKNELSREQAAMEARLSAQGEKRAVDIHNRIEPLATKLANMDGRLTQLADNVTALVRMMTARKRTGAPDHS